MMVIVSKYSNTQIFISSNYDFKVYLRVWFRSLEMPKAALWMKKAKWVWQKKFHWKLRESTCYVKTDMFNTSLPIAKCHSRSFVCKAAGKSVTNLWLIALTGSCGIALHPLSHKPM